MPSVCVLTGHRRIPPDERAELSFLLRQALRQAYGLGCRTFLCGGAMGFDRLAADTVLSLQGYEMPDARLHVYLPCRTQAAHWSKSEQKKYERQLEAADEVTCLSEAYYTGCMKERNRRMAESADYCIAYLTTTHSGSYQTARMASECGCPVINIAHYLKKYGG